LPCGSASRRIPALGSWFHPVSQRPQSRPVSRGPVPTRCSGSLQNLSCIRVRRAPAARRPDLPTPTEPVRNGIAYWHASVRFPAETTSMPGNWSSAVSLAYPRKRHAPWTVPASRHGRSCYRRLRRSGPPPSHDDGGPGPDYWLIAYRNCGKCRMGPSTHLRHGVHSISSNMSWGSWILFAALCPADMLSPTVGAAPPPRCSVFQRLRWTRPGRGGGAAPTGRGPVEAGVPVAARAPLLRGEARSRRGRRGGGAAPTGRRPVAAGAPLLRGDARSRRGRRGGGAAPTGRRPVAAGASRRGRRSYGGGVRGESRAARG
jgi:hypothetical protein